MDDLILEKNLKETLNKKSEEIGGSLADQGVRRLSCLEAAAMRS